MYCKQNLIYSYLFRIVGDTGWKYSQWGNFCHQGLLGSQGRITCHLLVKPPSPSLSPSPSFLPLERQHVTTTDITCMSQHHEIFNLSLFYRKITSHSSCHVYPFFCISTILCFAVLFSINLLSVHFSLFCFVFMYWLILAGSLQVRTNKNTTELSRKWTPKEEICETSLCTCNLLIRYTIDYG